MRIRMKYRIRSRFEYLRRRLRADLGKIELYFYVFPPRIPEEPLTEMKSRKGYTYR